MQANRGRDTSPETLVRSLLHARGLRFRVCAPLPFDRRRRADITFSRVGLFVFIDGCFWHGCPQHYQAPKTNSEFWRNKVVGNRDRDADSGARLRDLGFHVLRVWEHEDPTKAADRIISQYWELRADVETKGRGDAD